MTKAAEFQLAAEVAISDRELDNARRLLRNGEITQEDFAWVCGLIDDEEIPFHKMTAAQKRRYFAQKRQNDLFGRPKKVRKSRLSKAKELFGITEVWIGKGGDVSP